MSDSLMAGPADQPRPFNMTTWNSLSTTTTNTSSSTTTHNCTRNPDSRLVTLEPVFMTYYFGCMAAVTVLNMTGNVLVLMTIARHRCLWLPGNVFICSLAVSDLLFAFVFPLYNVAGINRPGVRAVFGNWSVCRVLVVEALALEICSAYALVAITASRYISVAFPLRHHHYITPKTCVVTVIVIWVTSHTTCVTVYAMEDPRAVSTGSYCEVCRYETMFTGRELGVMTVLQFILPFTLMLLFYLRMACMARKLSNRVATENMRTSDGGNRRSSVFSQRRHRPFIVITLLIGCFVLSYAPMIVYFFLIIVNGKSRTQYEYLSATSRIFLFLNTAVNVFIYAGRIGDFRECLRRDLHSCCSCLPSRCRRYLATSPVTPWSPEPISVQGGGMTSRPVPPLQEPRKENAALASSPI